MNKDEFLIELQKAIKQHGIVNGKQYIDYYAEYIDDLLENGYSEMAAIKKIGSPNQVLLKILGDEDVRIPKLKNRLENMLLVISLPMWGPLVVAALVIMVAFAFALLACTTAFLLGGIWDILTSLSIFFNFGLLDGLIQFGFGILFAGLGILFFELTLLIVPKIMSMIKTAFQSFKERRA